MDGSMGGLFPTAAAPTGVAGPRMPARLACVRLTKGRPEGLNVPALTDREVVAAWRKALPRGPFYVRCTDRRTALPIEHVQRLARVAELWLDGPIPDAEAGLDFLVAGAHRLIVWLDEAPDARELLESLGDSAVVGWNGGFPWPEAAEVAAALGVPLVCAMEPPSPPPASLDVYRIDLAAAGPSFVERVQQAAPPPGATAPGAVGAVAAAAGALAVTGDGADVEGSDEDGADDAAPDVDDGTGDDDGDAPGEGDGDSDEGKPR